MMNKMVVLVLHLDLSLAAHHFTGFSELSNKMAVLVRHLDFV